jgi:hypothetical protein
MSPVIICQTLSHTEISYASDCLEKFLSRGNYRFNILLAQLVAATICIFVLACICLPYNKILARTIFSNGTSRKMSESYSQVGGFQSSGLPAYGGPPAYESKIVRNSRTSASFPSTGRRLDCIYEV